MMRDLFRHLTAVNWGSGLLGRFATSQLLAEDNGSRDDGWKRIAVAADSRYGHNAGLRRLADDTSAFTEEHAASFQAPRTMRR